jgi:DNA-binding CsgD family transcriptional regulator/tetratricopeptide (TPR) repeat protein
VRRWDVARERPGTAEQGTDLLPVLVGRERELERLQALVEDIEERGGALVVRGEAGIGKSALLAAASEGARRQGVRVVGIAAVESETRLPFAGLHELLLPLLDRLDVLPEVQRHALEMALGLAPREAGPDVFLIGLATLGLVADVAAGEPLLFVVEDAQWIDRSSAMVLGFVARRLEAEPVLMWFAVRAGVTSDVDDAGLPEFALRGLSDDASAGLLEAQAAGLSPDLRGRILDEAAGNPLALIELPVAAKGLAFDARTALPGSLPLTARLEGAFAARLDELDADARALLVVAALEDGEPTELLQAAEKLRGASLAVHAWQPAADAGLGGLTQDRFRFRHPLIRSAVEQTMAVEERRAAHAALADVLAGDPDRSAWHRAEATKGQDEAAAAALAAAAERAKARGAGELAIAAFERSAALTPDPAVRGLRLWQAATLGSNLGRWQESSRLFTEAQQLGLPPFEDAYATLRLESFAGTMSSGDAVVAAFTAAAERLLADGEQQKALKALEEVSIRAYWGNLHDETKREASEVVRKIAVPANDPSRLVFLSHVDPIRNGREVLDELSRMSPAGVGDADTLGVVGLAATAVWADDVAIPFLRAAGERFRARGRLTGLVTALGSEAWAHLHRGAVLPGLTAAAESGRLAAETGLVLYVQAAKLAEAVAVAQRGEDDAARALLAETEAVLLPLGATPLLSFVALARGRVELAAGHYGAAYDRLARVFDHDDVAFHPFLRGHVLADLVDAAVGGDGDLDLVRGYVDDWQKISAETAAPFLGVQVSYAAAVLDEDDDAGPRFQAAITAADRGWGYYAARARLAYGVWLRRRQRRATDARAPLREAAEVFSALGQETAAERALRELRASGETARRRVPEAWAELTPQELQIAQLAAQGLSNKEIGERLYISPRTAGTHLYHLFPKLGITSRNQLRDALKSAGVS